jgi:hypothetical protein
VSNEEHLVEHNEYLKGEGSWRVNFPAGGEPPMARTGNGYVRLCGVTLTLPRYPTWPAWFTVRRLRDGMEAARFRVEIPRDPNVLRAMALMFERAARAEEERQEVSRG